MRKLLLLSLSVLLSLGLMAQTHIEQGFEDVTTPELPTGWTVIDNGDAALGTWESDNYTPRSGSQHVAIDTYDGAATGGADDYLITPAITLAEGDVLVFWASSWNGDYPDDIEVLASKSGATVSDFSIEVMANTTVPSGYTRYSVVLTENASLAAGDEIQLAFHCTSNGSGLDMDDIYVGEDLVPMMEKAFAVSDTELVVVYDKAVQQENIEHTFFHLQGSADITFDTAYVNPDKATWVHLWKGSANMATDLTVDTLIYSETTDTTIFYAGVMGIEYTNLTNPGGTMDIDYRGSFSGVVNAVNKYDDQVWFADAAGAYHGINANGDWPEMAVGDSVVIEGFFSPYKYNSDIYPGKLVRRLKTGVTPFPATVIDVADVDTILDPDVDPAEMYENVLVTLENVVISSFDDSGYDPYFFGFAQGAETATDPVVRIGDVNDIFDGTFGEGILSPGVTYNITGIVMGKYDERQVSPRSLDDIVPLNDTEAPTVSNELQTTANTKLDTVYVSSSEPGAVYIVLDGEPQASVADLEAAIEAHKAVKTEAMPGATEELITLDLVPGTYYAYGVDLANNLSDKGTNAITINSGAYELPFAEDFEGEKLIPMDWMLVNGDKLDPDGTSWDALIDSAWIVIESGVFGSNAAMATSYYAGELSYADDWLILPKVKLGPNSGLTWEAISLTTSGDYPDDYEVYVSTTTMDTAALKDNPPLFTITGESWREDADNPGEGIAKHQVALADAGYADQEVYIAFRLMTPHPGGDRLAIDNIMVTELDETAPVVSNDAQTVDVGDDVFAQSNEPTGFIYLILDGEPQSTLEELETAAASSAGTKAEVTAADTDVTLSTTDLIIGTYYAYAVDSAKNISDKGTNPIQVQEATDIPTLEGASIAIYPNPVKHVLYVKQAADIRRVVIANALGQEVWAVSSEPRDEFSISTAGLESGIYFITFMDDKGIVKTLKFIKQ